MPRAALTLVTNGDRSRAERSSYAAAVRAASWPGDPLERHVIHEPRRRLPVGELPYDGQTGLLNYAPFYESLVAMLRNRTPEREVSVLWIEILNLRREYALHGAKRTTALIRCVAGVLRSAAASGSLVGRFGDGCFLVAIEAAKEDKRARRQIQEITHALGPAGRPGGHGQVEVAAGVAFCPCDTDSPEDLVRYASLAAGKAADTRSASALAYRASMNHQMIREEMLEAEMGNGLDRGEFHIVYQPKVALANGYVTGAEALIRWDHPHLGSISPEEFVPIAERSHLIHRIVDFSLRTALSDARRWSEENLALPAIAVNVSAASLRRDDFVRSVRTALAEFPIAPTKLEIELTESMAFDDEELFAKRVRQLKDMGVRIAVDDFGTRYTGFNMLKELPLDAMKIDRCFVHGIDRSAQMQALFRTMVAMARQLGLHTVAEGVEDPAELAVLQECGCDAGQGYFFQRPVQSAEMAAFLRQWPERLDSFD
jgi:EAL domain-containing protein (putative c-di-GMP-specific phosphodiesterase class I)/GGDEF domain-containing protein